MLMSGLRLSDLNEETTYLLTLQLRHSDCLPSQRDQNQPQPQYLQDLISVQPCHNHTFFIYGHSCSPTYPLLFENH